MTTKEKKQLLADMNSVQAEIRVMQDKINHNSTLLKDSKFQEQRTKLFYKSYCIDCILRGEWAVRYDVYAKGE